MRNNFFIIIGTFFVFLCSYILTSCDGTIEIVGESCCDKITMSKPMGPENNVCSRNACDVIFTNCNTCCVETIWTKVCIFHRYDGSCGGSGSGYCGTHRCNACFGDRCNFVVSLCYCSNPVLPPRPDN